MTRTLTACVGLGVTLVLVAAGCGEDPAQPTDLPTDARAEADDPLEGDPPPEDAPSDGFEDGDVDGGPGLCGSEDACDDGVVCTEDRCDEATGACLNLPLHSACDGDGGVCSLASGCLSPDEIVGISPASPERIVEDPVSRLTVVASEAVVRLGDGASTADLQDALDSLPFEALVIGRLHTLPFAQVLFTELDDQAQLRALVEQVEGLVPVASAWIHPAGFRPTLLPDLGNDSGYVDLETGELLDRAWHLRMIQAIDAWDTTTGSEDVSVGLMDTGFAAALPDLPLGNAISFGSGSTVTATAENMGPLPIYTDLVDVISHGTIAGSLMGAEGNSTHGAPGDIVGVMWEAGFYAVRVDGSLLALAAGAEGLAMETSAASDNTALLYVGLGHSYYLSPLADSELVHPGLAPSGDNEYTTELVEQSGQLFESLLSEYPHLLVVQGAGNEGLHGVDASYSGLACAVDDPELADQVLCVASSTMDGEVAGISNPGGDRLAAPGGDLDHGLHGLTFEGEISETPVSGTSAAAAVTTGVAGLILSANPSLTPGEVHGLLVNNGTPIDPGVETPYDGYAHVDATAAVEAAADCVGVECAATTTTFTVNSMDDSDDGTCDGSHCSLREALDAAEAHDAQSLIDFAIPGEPPFVIEPTSALPWVYDDIAIDGTSQTGYDGAPVVEISGTEAGDATPGLLVFGDDVVLRGLSVYGFSQSGVSISYTTNVRVEGCYLGLSAFDEDVPGNGSHGIELGGFDHVIGGLSPVAGNVIAGNDQFGIRVAPAHSTRGSGASDIEILGNRVGTRPDGLVAHANGTGILVVEVPRVTIGSALDGSGNVISGNSSFGLRTHEAEDLRVQGNLIGTDATGTAPLPNGTEDGHDDFRGGVRIELSPGALFGGDAAGEGNVVAGNHGDGLRLNRSDEAVVQGNTIGLGSDGTTALGNTRHGVTLQTCQDGLVGGNSEGAGNTIGDNQDGVRVEAWVADLRPPTGTVVSGNRIGVSADGLEARGNSGHGISVDAGPGLVVGGSEDGAGNLIANSGGAGIRIGDGDSAADALAVAVLGNRWEDNGALALDLGNEGPNPDTPVDLEASPTGPPNGPTVAFAGTTDEDARVVGAHRGHPNTAYRIELFQAETCDESDQAQDGRLLAAFDGEADAAGSLVIDLSVSGDLGVSYTGLVDAGASLVATTTRGTQDDGDGFLGQATSELSACRTFGESLGEPLAIPDDTETEEDTPLALEPQANDLVAPGAGALTVVAVDDTDTLGTVAIEEAGERVRYTPPENFFGHDWFLYTVEDGAGAQSEAVVAVTVTPLNDDPVALPDEVRVLAGGSVVVDVVANDTDVDEDELSVSWVSDPAEATVTVNEAGALDIALTDQTGGLFVIDYQVTDGDAFDNATLTVIRYLADVHTYTVTTADDVEDGACDEGHCSLREAIGAASFVPGDNTVNFAIPGEPPIVITPASPLPPLGDGVVVDGASQPGFIDVPLVELDGAGEGEGIDGLTVSGDGVTITAVAVYGFTGTGVVVEGSGATITASWIGLTPRLESVQGNGGGIAINGGADTVVGGTDQGAGNVIANNQGNGLRVSGTSATGTRIIGNLIGTDPYDTEGIGNTIGVSLIEAGPTEIGGTTPEERNLISGNRNSGVWVSKGGPHQIWGNWIGTDSTGTGALGNDDVGVWVDWSANVQIGCAEAGCGNVICANGKEGIGLNIADGATIQGNLIGIGADGITPLGNGTSFLSREEHQNDEGIQILSGDSIRIGGSEPGQGNHIGANGTGIRLIFTGSVHAARPDGLVIQGNVIGSDLWYRPELGNAQYGIALRNLGGTLIGGDSPGAGNVIGANGLDGLWVSTSDPGTLAVEGNFIGTDRAGLDSLANGGHGIRVQRSGVITVRGEAETTIVDNTVAFNLGSGVSLAHETTDLDVYQARDVAILGNRIHSNGGLGIDLHPAGVTDNDDQDADGGANDGQNFPVLTAVEVGVDTATVQGAIDGSPDTAVRVELFANRFACPSSGHGQGEQYLGFGDVTTDGAGHAAFSIEVAFQDDWPRRFTATATASAERWIAADGVNVTRRQTSEYSPCFLADCTPGCDGRACGWDGCFDVCGTCDADDACANVCSEEGQCTNALDIELTCDFVDENCDGSTDEPFTTDGAFDQLGHCGTCNRACSDLPHQGHTISGVCDSDQPLPRCVYTCEDGYGDANGLPSDGCECEIQSDSDPIEAEFPFVDANCDGVDGIDSDGDGFPAGSGDGQDCADDDPLVSPAAWDWADGACGERMSWTLEDLDIEARERSRPSLLVGPEGDLAIVYPHDDHPAFLRILRRVDGLWHIEDQVAADKQVSSDSTDAVLHSDGSISMTYRYDDPKVIDGELRVVRVHDRQVTVETVDDGGENRAGFSPSIALDGDGYLHVAYTNWDEFSRPSLHYATNRSGDWVTSTVAASGVSDGTDIAVDAAGTAYIAAFGTLGRQTAYFTNGTGEWVSEVVDPDRHLRGDAAIAVDESGDVHFAYWADEERMLYYGVRSETGWAATPVGPVDAMGGTDLVIDDSGTPHIAWNFYNFDRSALGYATDASGEWTVSIPSAGVDPLARPALAIGSGGLPLVAFAGRRGLSLATADATGTVCGDAEDSNCDDVDGVDFDGDEFANLVSGGDDCDDDDASVNPGIADEMGDDTDLNCDGHDGVDFDGDGFANEASGGDDCRDDVFAINPDATDTVGNGEDENCDDADGVDEDGDGFANEASGGWDCADDDEFTLPEDCSRTVAVNSSDDDDDGSCDGSHCSLREAIEFANVYPGQVEVGFSIAGSGPHTITLTDVLDPVEGTVTIDGTTEPGYAGVPQIQLNGLGLSGSYDGDPAWGLRLTSDGNVVRALALYGFKGTGITIEGDGNQVSSCYVGTNVSEAAGLGSEGAGILIRGAGGNVIGGDNSSDGNVISGNGSHGVWLVDADDSLIAGNLVGTGGGGDTGVPNQGSGVVVDGGDGVRIGGIAPQSRNTISGNGEHGIVIRGDASDFAVEGNRIGLAADTATDLGNGQHGIEIRGGVSGGRVGGSENGAGNFVAFNSGAGVALVDAEGGGGQTPQGVAVVGNSTFSNDGLGVDLGVDGVTPNDGVGDADAGPNGLINTPVFQSITLGLGMQAQVLIEGEPNERYRLELFANTACDASGSGEGETFIYSGEVQLTGSGTTVYSANVTGLFAAGTPFTATLTHLPGAGSVLGASSEFSPCAGPACAAPCGCGETCDFGLCVFHGCDDYDCGDDPVCGVSCGTCGGDSSCVANRCSSTFAVTSSDDADDGTCDVGHCSLREALNGANASGAPSRIEFSLTGDPPFIIQPASPLPSLTVAAEIDGMTQSGWVDEPVVAVYGDDAGLDVDGLSLAGPDSVVSGLAVYGFHGYGISVLPGADRTRIKGSYVGTAPWSHAVFGNGAGGIRVTDCDTVEIGVPGISTENVIARNEGPGITLVDTTNAVLFNNAIGSDWDSAADLGNQGAGILLEGASNTRIGDDENRHRNVIADNEEGIRLQASASGQTLHTIVQNNDIGVAADSVTALGNDGAGIVIEGGSSSLIGGTQPLETNAIKYNDGAGVLVLGEDSLDNTVLFNAFVDNTGLAIDLGGDGVTPNDGPGDPDSGPNGLQNRPVLNPIVVAEGDTTISGTLTTAEGDYRVEIMDTATCDGSGSGQSDRFLVHIDVAVSGSGEASFEYTIPSWTPASRLITAKATSYVDADGQIDYGATSEFSACATEGCVPTCGIRTCGDNGCGGSCGSCEDGHECLGGYCGPPGPVCDDGNAVDWDGCTAGYVTEFLLDPDPDNGQELPSVSPLHEGGWVAAWATETDADGTDVRAQIRDRTGAATSTAFTVNGVTAGDQTRPRIEGLNDNTFVVVWDGNGDPDDQGIYLSRYDAAGTLLQDNMLVNTTTTGDQLDPQVSQYFYGGFVVVWRGPDETSGTGNHFFMRQFQRSGAPVSDQIQLVSANEPIGAPSASFQEDGRVQVAWQGPSGEPSGTNGWVQPYNLSGASVADAGRVAPGSHWTEDQSPRIGKRSESAFAVVWQSDGSRDGDGSGVFARIMRSNATPWTTTATLSEVTSGDQTDPRVSGNSSGTLIAVWTSDGQDGDGLGVYARSFSNALDTIDLGTELHLNAFTVGDQSQADVGRFRPGAFVSVWTGVHPASGVTAVYARRFDTDGSDCTLGACETAHLATCPSECNDNNPCTTDSCDEDIGCLHAALPDDSSCGEGITCQNAICQ